MRSGPPTRRITEPHNQSLRQLFTPVFTPVFTRTRPDDTRKPPPTTLLTVELSRQDDGGFGGLAPGDVANPVERVVEFVVERTVKFPGGIGRGARGRRRLV